MLTIEQIIRTVPGADHAAIRGLPPPALKSLRTAIERGWRVSVTGRRWELTHPTGERMLTTGEGLRFIGVEDLTGC